VGVFFFFPPRMILEEDHCESAGLFRDPDDLKGFRHSNMDNKNGLKGPEQGHCHKMSCIRYYQLNIENGHC